MRIKRPDEPPIRHRELPLPPQSPLPGLINCYIAPFANDATRAGEFFEFFRGHSIGLRAKEILDFGSGYGGRTVEYAQRYGARFAWGVEPFEVMVRRSREYAEFRGALNVEFRLCGEFEIPLPDASVDLVLSYDVLEHVRDPRRSMAEISRVLRPGGHALLVFPVYWGVFSHHLDYVSLLPGLHWLFSADTLVRAVNSILTPDGKKFGTGLQPEPRLAFDGSRRVLPSLNGLHGGHLSELFRGFEIIRLHRHGWLRRRKPRSAIMALLSNRCVPMRLRDAITSSISCILQKRDTANGTRNSEST